MLILKVIGALGFIMGISTAIINKRRAEPPFTIMEKKEEIDEKAIERIKKMIEQMKE